MIVGFGSEQTTFDVDPIPGQNLAFSVYGGTPPSQLAPNVSAALTENVLLGEVESRSVPGANGMARTRWIECDAESLISRSILKPGTVVGIVIVAGFPVASDLKTQAVPETWLQLSNCQA